LNRLLADYAIRLTGFPIARKEIIKISLGLRRAQAPTRPACREELAPAGSALISPAIAAFRPMQSGAMRDWIGVFRFFVDGVAERLASAGDAVVGLDAHEKECGASSKSYRRPPSTAPR
jgi:hypothetical protein